MKPQPVRADLFKTPGRPEDSSGMRGLPASERFRQIVLPHLGDALALARWLTGNAHDAEDIVQDACVKAFGSIDTYAGGSARAWLLTIVRNAAFTWLKKNRPQNLVLVGDLQDLDARSGEVGAAAQEPSETPEATLIAKAETAVVEAAIAALPTVFREVLVLRDINGLSYADIATMISIPIGTVMSRLARARGLLVATIGGGR